jgi:hypothetical protein
MISPLSPFSSAVEGVLLCARCLDNGALRRVEVLFESRLLVSTNALLPLVWSWGQAACTNEMLWS